MDLERSQLLALTPMCPHANGGEQEFTCPPGEHLSGPRSPSWP
jgi:hypothetical protein